MPDPARQGSAVSPGVAGWLGAGLCIAAADLVALATGTETVTAVAHRAATHPAGRTLIAAVTAAAIAHLIVEPHLTRGALTVESIP